MTTEFYKHFWMKNGGSLFFTPFPIDNILQPFPKIIIIADI